MSFPKRFAGPILGMVYALVFLTGAAGLVYQVAWHKYLGRLLGNDSLATAVILAAFLGGLSVGYFVCGKLSGRVKDSIRAYAVLEGVIGVWCLFFPSFFHLVESAVRSWSFSLPGMLLLQGGICSVLLMGIPTICMGGTIPLLTRGLSASLSDATRVHARIYGINTAGAFAGTLFAGFYMIPVMGLPVTIMTTAFLNLGIFLVIFFSAGFIRRTLSDRDQAVLSEEPVEEATRETPTISSPSLSSPFRLYFIALCSGVYVMTLENVFIRITGICLGSSAYSFSLIISVFILAIAVGSFAVDAMKSPGPNALFHNQMAVALCMGLLYFTLDSWPYAAHLIRISVQSNAAGFVLYYLAVFGAISLMLLVPVAFMGATVPLIFHEIKRDLASVGRHSGMALSWNTVGSLCGSLAGGILLFYWMDLDRIYLITVLLAAVSALLASMGNRNKGSVLAGAAMVGMAGMLLLAAALNSPPQGAIGMPVSPVSSVSSGGDTASPARAVKAGFYFNREHFVVGTFRGREALPFSFAGPTEFFRRLNGNATPVFYDDGPAATVAVMRKSPDSHFGLPPTAVYVNGKSDSSTVGDMYTIKLLAHLPALMAARRDSAMVIGLGTGVTAAELTLYPEFRQIDVAEISPAVIQALPQFSPFLHGMETDPRVKIHEGDAFRILGRSPDKWDMVISEPSNPWTSGTDSLFTQDFYRLVREHLHDDGILVQWAHIYASGPEMLGMILRTIRTEFPVVHVFMIDYSDLLIMASMNDIDSARVNGMDELIAGNPELAKSLSMIRMDDPDALLLREIWPPEAVTDRFQGYGIQTLDNPVLHYVAGRSFFMGEVVPLSMLFHSDGAFYADRYLLTRKYDAPQMPLPPKPEVLSLLTSSDNIGKTVPLPMKNALRIKAHLTDPAAYPLSDEARREMMLDKVDLITGAAAPPLTFDPDTGIPELMEAVAETRSWIASYPLDGLKRILSDFGPLSKKAEMRNRYRLHLLRILLMEQGAAHRSGQAEPQRDIQQIFSNLERLPDGRIIIFHEDISLLQNILSMMAQLKK